MNIFLGVAGVLPEVLKAALTSQRVCEVVEEYGQAWVNQDAARTFLGHLVVFLQHKWYPVLQLYIYLDDFV